MTWKLSDAKNRLSELLDLVGTEGPQTVRRRHESFVVVPLEQYEALAGKRPSFKGWLRNGPGFEGLDLERDKSLMRDIEL